MYYEFGNTAFVIKENEKVIAYLFGFFSQTERAGYVHLIGVRKSYQYKGLGKLLYDNFEAISKGHGCIKLKAMTIVGNQASILFHKKLGMKLLGEKNVDGIEVVKGYSAPGHDRFVLKRIYNCPVANMIKLFHRVKHPFKNNSIITA